MIIKNLIAFLHVTTAWRLLLVQNTRQAVYQEKAVLKMEAISLIYAAMF